MIDDVAAQIEDLTQRNALIRAQVSRLREFVDSLQRLIEALDQSGADEHAMDALSRSLCCARHATGAALGMLLVLDEDSDELVTVLAHGEGDEPRLTWHRAPAASGFAGWVLRHGQPVIANDARMDERFEEKLDDELGLAVRSVLAVPVIAGGRVLGVFQLLHKGAHALFDEDDQTLVTLMSRFAGELLHRMSR